MRNKNNGVRGVRELSDPPPPGSGEVEVRIRAASKSQNKQLVFLQLGSTARDRYGA